MNRHPHAPRAGPRRALAAALAAAALTAAPAEAQRKDASPRAAPPAASRTAPAPAAVPLPPPPAASAAPAAPPARAGSVGVAAAAWAGLEAGTAVALQVDYGVERTPASWRRAALEYRVAVLLARPSDEVDVTRTAVVPGTLVPIQLPAGTEETRAWVVEVVPTVRVRKPFERFALFADAGFGLAQTLERRERDETFVGRTVTTENVTGLVGRLGAGMAFDLSPRTRLLFQPVALSLQLGPSYSAYMASLGLSYRM